MNDGMKRIRARAYEIWEEEGRPEGRERAHCEQAVRETGASEDEIAVAVERASTSPTANDEPLVPTSAKTKSRWRKL